MKVGVVFGVLLTLLVGTVASGASLEGWEAFLGLWVNMLPDGSPTRVIIEGSDQSSLSFRGYGACIPTDCDWGSAPLWIYGEGSVDATEATMGVAYWESGFSENIVTIRFQNPVSKSVLIVDHYTRFTDASGRPSYHTIGYLRSTCDCDGPDLDCKDFLSHAEAQACYDYCLDMGYGDVFGLDRDGDGSACEALQE